MAPYLMSPMARAQLASVQQRYPAQVRQPAVAPVQQPQPFSYQMIDQRTGKPFQFNQTEQATPASFSPSGDPTPGSLGGDNVADRTPGPPQGGIEGASFGNAGSWGSRGAGVGSALAGLSTPVGAALGLVANGLGSYSDYQAAKAVARNLGLDENALDPTSAFASNTMLGMLGVGNSFPEQVEGLQQGQMEQAGKDFTSAVDRSVGASTEGMAGNDSNYYRGGLVTQGRLRGPNPPGPDDGQASLKVGEHVLTQQQWKRLPKKSRKAASR